MHITQARSFCCCSACSSARTFIRNSTISCSTLSNCVDPVVDTAAVADAADVAGRIRSRLEVPRLDEDVDVDVDVGAAVLDDDVIVTLIATLGR